MTYDKIANSGRIAHSAFPHGNRRLTLPYPANLTRRIVPRADCGLAGRLPIVLRPPFCGEKPFRQTHRSSRGRDRGLSAKAFLTTAIFVQTTGDGGSSRSTARSPSICRPSEANKDPSSSDPNSPILICYLLFVVCHFIRGNASNENVSHHKIIIKLHEIGDLIWGDRTQSLLVA
jgi:hypothetical protein